MCYSPGILTVKFVIFLILKSNMMVLLDIFVTWHLPWLYQQQGELIPFLGFCKNLMDLGLVKYRLGLAVECHRCPSHVFLELS